MNDLLALFPITLAVIFAGAAWLLLRAAAFGSREEERLLRRRLEDIERAKRFATPVDELPDKDDDTRTWPGPGAMA